MKITKIVIHEKLAASLEKVFKEFFEIYGIEGIKKYGVVRR